MTREELEVIVWRELSTLVSLTETADAILIAADSYAQTECENAIGAVT